MREDELNPSEDLNEYWEIPSDSEPDKIGDEPIEKLKPIAVITLWPECAEINYGDRTVITTHEGVQGLIEKLKERTCCSSSTLSETDEEKP